MSLIEKFVGRWERDHAELELDDIQATVLREQPEPYYGTHVILHFDDRGAGREFLRRITPHVRSAAEWWQGEVPWIGIGLSHAGRQRLGVPRNSLDSFPDSSRAGMAGRAEQLVDVGPNAPDQWERVFREEDIHAAVTVFSATREQ